MHTHTGALFTLKKEESPAICDSTDGPAGHYSKQSKSETDTTDLPSPRDQRQTGPRSRGGRLTAVTQRCHEGHRVPVMGEPGSGTRGDHSERDCARCRDMGKRQTLSVLATDTEEGKSPVTPWGDRRVQQRVMGYRTVYACTKPPRVHLKHVTFVFVSHAPYSWGTRTGCVGREDSRGRKAPAEGRGAGERGSKGPHGRAGGEEGPAPHNLCSVSSSVNEGPIGSSAIFTASQGLCHHMHLTRWQGCLLF